MNILNRQESHQIMWQDIVLGNILLLLLQVQFLLKKEYMQYEKEENLWKVLFQMVKVQWLQYLDLTVKNWRK